MKPTKSKKSSADVDQSPRYDIRLNPPYQINYRAKRAGKHISASKRRITFQFGFSSAAAIAAGRTEVECRGEEHEVVLVWSHITGKRQLFMDGREIHMSKAARGNTKFEYSWGIPGNHVLKIAANGTPSSSSQQAMGRRQFQFELDGMSFFEFARIYELGRGDGRGASERRTPHAVAYSYRGTAYDARDDEEEEEDAAQLKVSSVDLFDTQPSITSPQSITSPVSNYSAIPSLGSITSSNSSVSSDEFTPVEARKSFDCISQEILHAYSADAPPTPSASFQPSSSRALVPVSEEGIDQISKSMKNLVNLDDITTTPLAPIAPNSPSLSSMKSGQANWGLVGRAPTLAEIRDSSLAQNSGDSTQQRDVMQPFAPQQAYHQTQQPQALVACQGAQGVAPSYGYMGYAAY